MQRSSTLLHVLVTRWYTAEHQPFSTKFSVNGGHISRDYVVLPPLRCQDREELWLGWRVGKPSVHRLLNRVLEPRQRWAKIHKNVYCYKIPPKQMIRILVPNKINILFKIQKQSPLWTKFTAWSSLWKCIPVSTVFQAPTLIHQHL